MGPLTLADIPLPALLVSATGSVLGANQDATALLGVTAAELYGRDLAELLGPDAALIESGAAGERLTISRASGDKIIVDVSSRPLEDGGVLVLLSELDLRRDQFASTSYFDGAFETASIGMAVFNTDGEFVRVNRALCEMLGRPSSDLLGRRDQSLTYHEDRQRDAELAFRALSGELDTYQIEKRYVRSDGGLVWTTANLTFLRDDSGRPLSWVGQFQDVTARYEHTERLQHLADHDPLTELLNRRAFEAELARVTAGAVRLRVPAALLMLDLDGFKPINDHFGHAAGDRVLRAVANCLRQLRGSDVVGRIGGDEFAVILAPASMTEADLVARRIVRAIDGLELDDRVAGTRIAVSVGIAQLGPAGAHTAAAAIDFADAAMYRAKTSGCEVAAAA